MRKEKHLLEGDVIARGLQKFEVQNHARWLIGCKNRLTSAFMENLLNSRNTKKSHTHGAK